MNTLLTPEAFAQHVVKATRKAGYRVTVADGMVVECTIGGESLRCNLETAYNHYQEAPEKSEQDHFLPRLHCGTSRSGAQLQ